MLTLSSDIREIKHLGPSTSEKLEKLGVRNVRDLLYLIPNRYIDYSKCVSVNRCQIGETVTIKASVVFIKNQYTKTGKKLQLAEIKDKTGSLLLIWFNQPYLNRILFTDDMIFASGLVGWFGGKKAIISPIFERADKAPLHTGKIIPVYPETKGLSSKFLRNRINEILPEILDCISDPIPEYLLKRFDLLPLDRAIANIHFPLSDLDCLNGKKRLAFDEMLALYIASYKRRQEWSKYKLKSNIFQKKYSLSDFIKLAPFELTQAQKRVIKEIFADMESSKPMNRLLEGDVGSGKTIVAAAAIVKAFKNGYKSALMAPTQILAQQHYQTLTGLLKKTGIKIGLITSNHKEIPEICDLFIGTHALISNTKHLTKVGLVIIDEQHKFGVNQRSKLISNSKEHNFVPHVLSMTATPIPRTIALTVYGDLDLSVIDEMPKNRISPKTWIVPSKKESSSYDWIKTEIKNNKTSVFVVCPLIGEDENDGEVIDDITKIEIANVKAEYKKLEPIFREFKLAMLFSKQKPKEKENNLTDFKKGIINILVSTPVIEVGVDIPSANIMVIKGADRFGLAQLHQLRGRVGRAGERSYCLLYTKSTSESVIKRLSAMQKETSGFKLAELDLELRGPGQFFGIRQHGLPELKIATWNDPFLMHMAKQGLELLLKNKDDVNKIYLSLQNTSSY